jgi:ubiquinone/menaquinone biosynthesis C-methylase UbiE
MSYLMAGQQSELDRLRLQSRVWEPAGERLLTRLGDGSGLRAAELGCGAMGWLRILSRWIGPSGEVIGTDIDEKMLAAASALCNEDALANVAVRHDDIFASALPEASFDLVHLRFQLAPIGRAKEHLAAARRLARRGGWLVLEEPDSGSWRENPLAPSAARLRALVIEAFARSGGDFDAGRRLPEYLRAEGIEPSLSAECVTLEPGHPYLQLPVQFATSLRPRLLTLVPEEELDRLLEFARVELAEPARWGTTFTLVQAWGRVP